MVDIQISVTEPRAAGLVQLIVFMYSSNRRPGPASVMLLLWNKDDGKDIEASNPIQSMPWKHYIGSPKYLKLFSSDDHVKVWAVLCCTDAMWCVGRPSSPCTTMCTLLLSDVEWWPNKAMVLFSVSSALSPELLLTGALCSTPGVSPHGTLTK